MRARVNGSNSLGWVEVLEGWGAEIEAMVVSSLDHSSHIRALVTTTPTTALHLAYHLPPCGPWDGCLAANILTTEDAHIYPLQTMASSRRHPFNSRSPHKIRDS